MKDVRIDFTPALAQIADSIGRAQGEAYLLAIRSFCVMASVLIANDLTDRETLIKIVHDVIPEDDDTAIRHREFLIDAIREGGLHSFT